MASDDGTATQEYATTENRDWMPLRDNIRLRNSLLRRADSSVGRKDPCSAANFHEVDVTHLHIDWTVHFPLRMLIGSATLTCQLKNVDINRIVLDVRDLAIRSVQVNGRDAEWRIAPNTYTFFGSTMKIYLPADLAAKDKPLTVIVNYSTSPEATALQWLSASQTADKAAPYLFSQCQAIHARSIVPCMDTPSVKHTYSAKVKVSDGLTCLMSAIGESPVQGEEGLTTYSFRQTVPVPSYLVAIVVGKLEKRDISDRVAVWAESSVVEKAAWEFAETERFLATAEELCGPYIWGRYDMVCLPPSFPFGGMENPCLTFLTPTLISGDRSLVNVIAHEIAHSWSGNYVTNATWEHFWLNEGWTVFIERKVIGRIVSEDYRHFMALNGWTNALTPAVNEQFSPTHPFTRLIQEHENVDPDVAFSCVPYEKGSAFLMMLEQKLGGTKVFEEYMRSYLRHFAHQSIDSFQWKNHLLEYFADQKEVLAKVDFDAWFFGLGMPPVKPEYDRELTLVCEEHLAAWVGADESATKAFDTKVWDAMQPLQRVEVLSQLWQHDPPLEHFKVERLNELYKLNESQNCEILFNWLRLCIKARWEPCIERALQFVSSQGRMKYCRPVYRDLAAWPTATGPARKTYLATRGGMHPITGEMIAKDLHMRHSTHSVAF